ncbi:MULTISPECIES: hypothetical protein [Micromonospora]|uniref:Uncharacterized protein n=1 Tax=Micromonospora carbonacea TaxID=47853 RepID=A0A7H8XJI4_9ACTN|nr:MULTISPECIES: hypothetical protein [Micromonospora]MBB5827224.1 hypothetical protein [Micromonospora carbonacea]MDG4818849.1 hypothetical protein [Micromonospora sp. WMMD956]QLD24985.1 hypothetical protein HXZ27_12835 [Micromonospora carbonacea]WFE55347.1 hypothetical protein O7633_00060 [Micromonospora sp. WMMD712]
MSYPPHSPYPPGPGAVAPLTAYPQPIPPPPGHAVLVVSVNRGPYLVPAPATSKFKIDGRTVPIPGEGTWHVAVPAGPHDVRYTDFIGIPVITTALVAQPGAAHHLSFRFGGWRNRVHDGHGTDVTRFGMWSNYSIMLVTLAVLGVLCCGGFGLVAALSGTS